MRRSWAGIWTIWTNCSLTYIANGLLGFSKDLADLFLEDYKRMLSFFEKHPVSSPMTAEEGTAFHHSWWKKLCWAIFVGWISVCKRSSAVVKVCAWTWRLRSFNKCLFDTFRYFSRVFNSPREVIRGGKAVLLWAGCRIICSFSLLWNGTPPSPEIIRRGWIGQGGLFFPFI